MKAINVVKKMALAVLAFLLIGCVFTSVKTLGNAYADGETTATTITFTETKVNVSTDGTKILIATGINNTEYLSNVSELGYKIEGYEVKESDFAETKKYYSSITLGETKQTASDIFGESATENSKLVVWEVAYTVGSTYKITAYATVYTDGTASEVKGTERSYECVKFDSKLTTIPTAKADLVYTGSAQALVEAGTTADGTIQYKLGTDGTYGTTIPTATNAGTYTVYYKVVADDNHNDSAEASVDVTIAKAVNTITLSVNLDCNWGSGPDETKATATYGTPVYTYWLSNSDSTGGVTEPDSDAVFKSWSECNAVGVYKCKISVAESENYQAGEIHTWVRVHKKETDANGVKYTYGDGAYYVSGYVGSSTEVTVASTFNDGVNGEKSVTLVGQECAWGTTVTKIILPACITDFKGNSFQSATNLEYISMTGVTHISTGNNFINNQKITTVIVNKAFTLDNQQFKMHGITADPTVVIYVDGTKAESSFAYVNKPSEGIGNEFLTGVVYYLGDGTKCLTWKFDDDGNIVKGASAHTFEDDKCTVCGIYNTQGVNYVYDSTNQCYYVGDNKTLNVSELTILSKYNDGTNGEHNVTYVAKGAFGDYNASNANQYITKVILPETVTDLGGLAFASCTKLVYVDARGVSTITYNRSDYTRPDGSTEANNNFFGCSALTTVIIGNGYSSNVGQFSGGNASSIALYVYGTTAATLQDGDSAVDKTKIYYYSETQPTDTAKTYWHYVDGVATVWEKAE